MYQSRVTRMSQNNRLKLARKGDIEPTKRENIYMARLAEILKTIEHHRRH